MIHIGLFEGIGGFSLASEWMGWKTLATCEINAIVPQVALQIFKAIDEFRSSGA